jgi:hypothetical protein
MFKSLAPRSRRRLHVSNKPPWQGQAGCPRFARAFSACPSRRAVRKLISKDEITEALWDVDAREAFALEHIADHRAGAVDRSGTVGVPAMRLPAHDLDSRLATAFDTVTEACKTKSDCWMARSSPLAIVSTPSQPARLALPSRSMLP